MMIYPTWDAAVARVTVLTKDLGLWPGIIQGPDGYRLTTDPGAVAGLPRDLVYAVNTQVHT